MGREEEEAHVELLFLAQPLHLLRIFGRAGHAVPVIQFHLLIAMDVGILVRVETRHGCEGWRGETEVQWVGWETKSGGGAGRGGGEEEEEKMRSRVQI